MRLLTLAAMREMAPRLIPSVLVITLSMLPWLGSGLYETLIPNALLAAVFYWALFAPHWFPLWIMLLCSCLYDIGLGMPIGLTGTLGTVIWGALVMQRRFLVHRSFLTLWAVFAVVVLLYMMATALFLMSQGKTVNMTCAVFQFAVTTAVYPWLMELFDAIHRPMPS